MTDHRRPKIRFSDAPRGTCRWCGEPILHEDGSKRGEPNLRRRWHPECVSAYEESDPRLVRRRLRRRDRGVCAACGLDTVALRRSLRGRGMTRKLRERGFVPRRSLWDVDHIVPLIDGGSHALDNLQTLCSPCHRAKTAEEARARAERARVAAEPTSTESPAPKRVTKTKRKSSTPPSSPSVDALIERASQLNQRVEATLRSMRVRQRP